MLAAKSEVQIDNEQVRVTEWRLAPGSATGHHTHGMDYVIVPVVAGEMTIVAPGASVPRRSSRPENLTFARPASNTTYLTKPQPRSCSLRSS